MVHTWNKRSWLKVYELKVNDHKFYEYYSFFRILFIFTNIIHFYEYVHFFAITCLKEFRSTRLICFAKAVLVQSITSNIHQKCSFEQFQMSNQVPSWILKLLWSTGFEKLLCWSCYNCVLIFKKRVLLMISSTKVSAT